VSSDFHLISLVGCALVGHDSGNRSLLLHVLGLPLSAYSTISQTPYNVGGASADRRGAEGADLGR
jgi:hypothetical protein